MFEDLIIILRGVMLDDVVKVIEYFFVVLLCVMYVDFLEFFNYMFDVLIGEECVFSEKV